MQVSSSVIVWLRSWLFPRNHEGVLGLSAVLMVSIGIYLLFPVQILSSPSLLGIAFGSQYIAAGVALSVGVGTINSLRSRSVRWQVPMSIALAMMWWFLCAAAFSFAPQSFGSLLFGTLGLATMWCVMRVWFDA